MATRELNKDNFDEVVSDADVVLIDFWASWCGPCRMFAPIYERVSDKHQDIVFGKVDTEAEPELAGAFSISSIPTLMIVRDKVVLYAQPGAIPEPALEDLISQARGGHGRRAAPGRRGAVAGRLGPGSGDGSAAALDARRQSSTSSKPVTTSVSTRITWVIC